MPLDLAHPRYLAPFPASATPADPDKRRAVHLKLTEDVLKQLLDAANAAKGAPPEQHAIRINLSGPNPVCCPDHSPCPAVFEPALSD